MLTTPAAPAYEPIRSELIDTLFGHQKSSVFAALGVIALLAFYAFLYPTFYPLMLIALFVPISVWRVRNMSIDRQGTPIAPVLVSSLCWTLAVGWIGGECARTHDIALMLTAGIVITGITFGVAFSNSGAIGYAKLQSVILIVPFTFFAGTSGMPRMFVILIQAPLWLSGIWQLIGRVHAMQASLIQAQRRSKHLAYHDDLTSLPNRACVMERLSCDCGRTPSRADRSNYILYLDLDGFKAVNDTYGHPAGDELLRAVSGRFQSSMRPCDLFGRLGGDEFAAILAEMSSDQVESVAQRLIASAHEPFVLEGLPLIRVGVSIGGAPLSHLAGPDVALHAADEMLYAAKRAGKGVVRFA